MSISKDQIYPFVSVIIPVYNNSQALKKCLASLENQTYPKDCYEIIVVDNQSEENVEIITNHFPQVILSYEEKPGSYAARNRGISLAQGKIIAFTDSDCIAYETWIEKGVNELLKVTKVGLVGGKIELFFKDDDSPTAIEFYDEINNYLNQKQHIEKKRFGATANVFTLKSIFDDVGVFRDDLKSGGDVEWGQRVSSKGYKLIYSEEASVKHPARSSIKELYKRTIRVVGGLYDLGTYDQDKGSHLLLKEILKRIKPPVKYLRWRLSDQRLKKQEKFLFILVTIFVDYAVALELFRLKIGKKSERK
ncbi:glycosyltransferase [Roseofilum reptotaenium CS-1145]|uniref:Glycosyltransferase 2-like domain-containing protein n=1 Tax=Roseofilum reptotaenium AO1-A TaxID=1925591 RepID=A0A1L9QPW5_9CYAN|nr:glycosyltransferase [Roseofilum reptotaenium]MDB9516633.1 glycosyltransferase [Roseofilum reptotaenium CS-1145]OJJ24676.1 hypothetical protein BI308_15365 [Roseofilum reptotaenium AO1-A]